MNASLALGDVSIRARQVLGAICFRRFCVKYQIHHPEIEAFVAHCFALATASDLMAWERTAPPLAGSGLGDSIPDEILAVLPEEQVVSFSRLLREVTEVGHCDLYAAVSDRSRQHLLAVFNLLEDEEISIPDITPFRARLSTIGDGWENPVESELDRLWRSIQ